jgi:hypothetical protein
MMVRPMPMPEARPAPRAPLALLAGARPLFIALSAALSILSLPSLTACDKPLPATDDPPPSTVPADAAPPGTVAVTPTVLPALTGPMAPITPSNPLGLPPRRIKIDAGRRVFTFSSQMLSHAKLGSTLVLYGATIVGLEGDDLIVEGKGVPNFKVHPGYVIPVPDNIQVRPGDAVLTEYSTAMRHAVVTKLVKDKIVVRFTDMDTRMQEAYLKDARFIKQKDGLLPGNYAAVLGADDVRHVLLVSPAYEGDKKRWFVLGFGGAADLVDEASLRQIPVKWTPKVGASVWAEWVGTMRKATVQAADPPAFFTVKYERAGRPATVSWGLIMPPLEDDKPGKRP